MWCNLYDIKQLHVLEILFIHFFYHDYTFQPMGLLSSIINDVSTLLIKLTVVHV